MKQEIISPVLGLYRYRYNPDYTDIINMPTQSLDILANKG